MWSLAQTSSYYMIAFIWSPRTDKSNQGEQNQNISCLWKWKWGEKGLTREESEGTSRVMEIFHILIRVWAIIQVCASVRSHKNVIIIYFTVSKFYLIKKHVNQYWTPISDICAEMFRDEGY